jgi:hypothetical protein
MSDEFLEDTEVGADGEVGTETPEVKPVFNIMESAKQLMNAEMIGHVIDDALPTGNADLIKLAVDKFIDNQNMNRTGEKKWDFVIPPGKFVSFIGLLLKDAISQDGFFDLIQYIMQHPSVDKIVVTNGMPEVQTVFDSYTIGEQYFEEGQPFEGKQMRVEVKTHLFIENKPVQFDSDSDRLGFPSSP